MATPGIIQPGNIQNMITQGETYAYGKALADYQSLQANLNMAGVGSALPPPPDPNAYFPAGSYSQPAPQPAPQPTPQPQRQSQPLQFPALIGRPPQPQPGLLVGGQPNPAASVSNFTLGTGSAATPQQSTPTLPALNTSGVNPYLTDPLMSLYYGMQNPSYQQQSNFYGDPELFRAPTVAGSV